MKIQSTDTIKVIIQIWVAVTCVIIAFLLSVQLLIWPPVTLDSYTLFRTLHPEISVSFTPQVQSEYTKVIMESIFLPTETNTLTVQEKVPFTSAELSHLKDIQFLSTISRVVLLFLVIDLCILLYVFSRNYSISQLIHSTRIWQVYGVVCFILLLFGAFWWEEAFTLFHVLLFPAHSWYFPAESTFIQLYPEQFWQWIAGEYILVTTGCLLLLTMFLRRISIVLEKKSMIE